MGERGAEVSDFSATALAELFDEVPITGWRLNLTLSFMILVTCLNILGLIVIGDDCRNYFDEHFHVSGHGQRPQMPNGSHTPPHALGKQRT